MKRHIIIFSMLAITGISCEKQTATGIYIPDPSEGVYIINEGAFNAGNASVSFLNTSNGAVTNDIFSNVNGFPLGDVAQSMTIYNDKGYIVVNNSKKIEVVNLNDFTNEATITTGNAGPRYLVTNNNKGYISEWFDDNIKVIDLNTNATIKTIPTGSGPEQMIISDNKLFVANVGGYGNDSTVTVIDLAADTVLTTIQVGLNPNSLVSDANGKIWVLCGGSIGPDYIGGTADDNAGALLRIDPANYSIELNLALNSSDHPIKLQKNQSGNTIYMLMGNDGYTGKVSKMNIAGSVITNVIPNKDFYGLGIDPKTERIYGAFVPGFSQNGYVFRYTSSGSLIDSSLVGIAPSWFCFK